MNGGRYGVSKKLPGFEQSEWKEYQKSWVFKPSLIGIFESYSMTGRKKATIVGN